MTQRRIVKRTRVGREKTDGTVMKPLLRADPLGGGSPVEGHIPWVAEARLRDISSVMLGFVVGYCDVWEVV